MAVGLAGALFTGALGTGSAGATSFVNWAGYLYSPDHTSDNLAATTITPANAASLKILWKFKPSAAPISGLGGFYSSPTVYNGVVYIGARNGYFYALDEATGTVIWQRFIGYVPKITCPAAGFSSTDTVAPDPTTGIPTVYAYGATGYLYAMNAADGTDVWPPAVVAVPSATQNDYYAWSSPLVFGGNIYVGISSECDNPLVRAGIKEYSQATGALLNTFWTSPKYGASIWSSPATDGSSVFVTTGNGPKVTEGFSLIRLSPSLSQQSIWTVPLANRITDSDFGASPGVWTASVDGTPTEMVGACNKNGNFYAFQAANIAAGPAWTQPIGNPDTVGPGECDAAPLFDGANLYVATNGTTINSTAYDGSVQQVDPATGAPVWQTGLTGSLIGTPGMDGAGVIAAASYVSTTQQNALWLINAANGQILKTFPYHGTPTFAQPVFADSYLFVANRLGLRVYGLTQGAHPPAASHPLRGGTPDRHPGPAGTALER
jgi:outer membrane protein assembly factor BamB